MPDPPDSNVLGRARILMFDRAKGWLNRLSQRATLNAASRGRRMVGVASTTDGMNTVVLNNTRTVRERALHLYLNNPVINNMVEAAVANAVGTGIVPRSMHRDTEIRRTLNEAWDRWVERSDADGLTDFYGQQITQCRSIWIAGEAFSRLRPRRREDGLEVPLQVQTIEPAQLPDDKTEPFGGIGPLNRIVGGIEFDAIGRRVAYHFYRHHPGDASITGFSDAYETVRIPAEFVTHSFSPIQGNQVRGLSRFTPILTKALDLDGFDDATLVAQRMAANFIGTFEKLDQYGQSIGKQEKSAGDSTAPDGVAMVNAQPGTLIELANGEKLTWNKPPDPSAAYQEFVRVQYRAIAAGLGVTYEMGTGDLTGVTYLSGRLGRLEFIRRMEPFQFGVLVHQFIRPVVRQWISQAVLSGVIDARDYKRNQAEYDRWEFRTPKWAWIDPAKDVAATIDAIDAGLVSRDQSIVDMGEDPEEVDRQRALGKEREKLLGIEREQAIKPGGAIQAQQRRDAQPAVIQ